RPNTIDKFWDRFETRLERAFAIFSRVVIVGDLNENPLNRNDKLTPTMMAIDLKNSITQPTRRKVWLYKRGNYDQLNNEINEYNWSFIDQNSVDDSCCAFMKDFIDKHIPRKEVTNRPNDILCNT
ncbi:hypothetical protein MAR_037948, partial [Mya arenaria]